MDGSPGSCKSLSFIQVASLEDHGASWSIGLAVNICHFYLAHGSIANSINLTAAGFHLIGIRQAAFIYFHGVNYTKSPRELPHPTTATKLHVYHSAGGAGFENGPENGIHDKRHS